MKDKDINTPMTEVFCALFAVMLLILILIETGQLNEPSRQIEAAVEEGAYFVKWPGGGSGYAIQIFAGFIRIVETQHSIPAGEICENKHFQSYVSSVYSSRDSKFLLQVFNGGEAQQEELLDCLRTKDDGGNLFVAIMIADLEILKAIPEGRIPSYVETYLNRNNRR